jgi:hypothetical protein
MKPLERCVYGIATRARCGSPAVFYCDDGTHDPEQVAWCNSHLANCRGHEHPRLPAGSGAVESEGEAK